MYNNLSKYFSELIAKNKMTTPISYPNYLYYNLYLDSPVDYSRLKDIKILKIRENLPLTDKVIQYIIENNMKYIEFGEMFNQPIDILPSCVEHIFFHPNSKFNLPLVNLPCNLKTLIIGSGYWETLDHLPNSLLYLGYCKWTPEFNQKYPLGSTPKFEDMFPNLPANVIYISIPTQIFNKIDFTSATRIYKKNIIKCSSELNLQFMNLINERYNMDYFSVHG